MSEPTLDQLARFACVRTLGPYYTQDELALAVVVMGRPEVRAGWLERHREFQAALDAATPDVREEQE